MPAARGVRRRFRLKLPPRATPAVAIVWKNITALGRTMAIRTVIAIGVAIVIALVFLNQVMPATDRVSVLIGRIALGVTLMLVVAGPLWVRNDLRLDMLQLEVLRSLPVRGATLVRAELAAALVTLAAVQVPMLLVGYALTPPKNPITASWSGQTALLVTLLVVVPVVSALGLLVQNAGALLFPGWVRLGLARPGGIEAVGQGMLTMFGSLVVLTVCLAIPGALGGALAIWGVSHAGLWGLVPGAMLGAVLVAAELWWITAWLGRVFERTDDIPDETAANAA
jgi:hypothetical protein